LRIFTFGDEEDTYTYTVYNRLDLVWYSSFVWFSLVSETLTLENVCQDLMQAAVDVVD
jgi:hypothetical protein